LFRRVPGGGAPFSPYQTSPHGAAEGWVLASPQVNPIDFENAEGNLGLSTAVLEHLAVPTPRRLWGLVGFPPDLHREKDTNIHKEGQKLPNTTFGEEKRNEREKLM